MLANVVAGLVLSAVGVVTAWASRRAVAPNVDPQRAPGLRTPTTMASREAWLAAHRPIAPAMWWMGVVVVLAGIGVLGWSVIGSPSEAQVDTTVLVVAAGYFAVSLVLMVVGLRAAGRVVRN